MHPQGPPCSHDQKATDAEAVGVGVVDLVDPVDPVNGVDVVDPVDVVDVVLATVPDCHFGSGSRSQPDCCQIGDQGCQYTRSTNFGTGRW